MIKVLNNDSIVLDRNRVGDTKKTYDGKIISMTESEYQSLPKEIQENGATYITYNDEDA